MNLTKNLKEATFVKMELKKEELKKLKGGGNLEEYKCSDMCQLCSHKDSCPQFGND